MSFTLLPTAQMSAAESAAEATMFAVWLIVGVAGLAIGLVLVLRANREFNRSAARLHARGIDAVDVEPALTPAAA